MISQRDIEKALDFLRDSAESAAVNRSNRVYMEEFRKSLKAQLMSDNLDMYQQLPASGANYAPDFNYAMVVSDGLQI